MTRVTAYLLETVGNLRTDIRRRRSLHGATRVVPAATATHREIVLTNTTVQLDPDQIASIRDLQNSVQQPAQPA